MCWGLREPQSCWRNMPIPNSVCYVVCSVQSLSHVWLLATPWTAACQGLLFFTNSWSLGKFMSIKLVIPSNHLILCHVLSSCLQCCPITGSFLMSQFFTSVGQSIGGSISASVLPMNIQDWFPLGWLGGSPSSQRDSQESCPTPQFKTINSSLLTILYGATVTSIHDNWKNHSFDYTDLFQQSNISTFKKIVRVCNSFSSKEQASFNFMTAVIICSDIGAPENKVSHCFHWGHTENF